MSNLPLEQSISRTLTYFDLADFSLTKEELFRYLWVPPRMGYDEYVRMYEQYEHTNGETATRLFDIRLGYCFLPGREELVEKRRRALVYSEKKLKLARRAASAIQSIPFLKAIFVSSSVAAENSSPESDIDFFVITEPNRIWLVRLFANVVLRLLGWRVYGNKKKDRICLSFFVDSAHLDLAPHRVSEDDVHFAYWLNQMLPIYDPENIFSKFINANKWTEKYLPNMRPTPPRPPLIGGILGRVWKKMWEAMWKGSYGSLIEKDAKKIQWQKMKLALKERSEEKNNEVVISEGVIKLHENDIRRKYRQRWIEKLTKN